MIATSNCAAVEPPVPVPSGPPGGAPKKASTGARRRGIIALAVLAVVTAVAGVAWYERSRPARPAFRTALVARADITEHVTATGTLQPVITSPVGAQVSGIVWKPHADYNSKVKAGELLAELDPVSSGSRSGSEDPWLASAMGWPFVFSPFWVVVAFGISMGIGVWHAEA